ncbi:WG repeat-containing protein [Arachidicoccus ginsenosidivorans]|uniref:WG repeat-containing protein n=1 Tax=Arachidicoccus ginsenosidivorans TaxID=496057 RepID=A0A5B8VPN1_9BACT|nr:WG repeat-containing protein [Arachidicoccus ginsenosidivorans]QEC73587.1 WG repeat-containing protein [Arachidicoccus ginsenosidivorans]
MIKHKGRKHVTGIVCFKKAKKKFILCDHYFYLKGRAVSKKSLSRLFFSAGLTLGVLSLCSSTFGATGQVENKNRKKEVNKTSIATRAISNDNTNGKSKSQSQSISTDTSTTRNWGADSLNAGMDTSKSPDHAGITPMDQPMPLRDKNDPQLYSGHHSNMVSDSIKRPLQQTDLQLIPFQDAAGKWGYLDRSTRKVMIAPFYQWADLFENGVAMVTQPNLQYDGTTGGNMHNEANLYGWIDMKGEPIFKPQFTRVYDVESHLGQSKIPGLKLVETPDRKYGIIDLEAKDWVVKPGLHTDFTFYDRTHYLADKKVFVADGKTFRAPEGCIITGVDLKNRLFDIEKGSDLHKGIARWDGQVIIAPKYMDIEPIYAHKRYLASRLNKSLTGAALMALLQSKDASVRVISELIDPSGKVLGSYRSDYTAEAVQDSLGVYTRGDSSFYFSLETGAAVPAPASKDASQGDFMLFKKGLLWGVSDLSGHKIIVPPLYTELQFINNHLVVATKAEGDFRLKKGLIDLNNSGKVVIDFAYDGLEYVAAKDGPGPHFRAYKNGKYGILDMQGHVIVPIIYANTVLFNGQRAEVYKDYRSGVIDHNGKEIIAPKYKTIFSSKLSERSGQDANDESKTRRALPEYYAVQNEMDKWGLMDSTGKTVIPFDYGYVSTGPESFAKGWVSIEDTSRQHHGKFNILTGVKLPPVYDIIRIYDKYIIVAKRKGNVYNYQLLNPNGQPLTDSSYTGMDYNEAGQYLLCQQGRKYGVLDENGNILVPFVYDYLWPQKSNLLMAEKKDTYVFIDTKGTVYKQNTK